MNLQKIMEKKNTRLCFSADFTKKNDLLLWASLVGPDICILKTHIDILEDFDESVIIELKKLSKKYNFLIMEDRKFGDIGKTFEKQLFSGIYKIGSWADIITVHGISADGMLSFLEKKDNSPQVLIVSQMSSQDNLITEEYTTKCYNIAKKYPELVLGFISQKKFIDDDNFLFLTPGVKITTKKESDQNYRSPYEAIVRDKNDIIIVGSGIYQTVNSYFQEIMSKYKITSKKIK